MKGIVDALRWLFGAWTLGDILFTLALAVVFSTLTALAAWLAQRKQDALPKFRYDPDTDTVYMDLMDLEHCGFDHDAYDSELWVHGIEAEAARWPKALVVRFREGAVNLLEEEEDDG